MNKEVKVTIVMPVYNAERYLKKSIDSVLSQTFKNFVFIIINDGSTDKSEEIIYSYNDSRINYIKNERNLGIVRTLNKGFELANTKYIARMDADDICDERRLELQFNEMEKDDDIALLGTSADLIDENDQIIGEMMPPQDDVKIRTSLLFSNVFIHSSVMIRNSILYENKWKYDINHKAVEDYGLWLKISDRYKVKILSVKLLKYRINTDGIMASANKDKEQLIKNHSIIYKEYLERNGILINENLLLDYANFINVNYVPNLKLSRICNLLDTIKMNIVSEDKYDIKLYESLLSAVSRSYAIVAHISIKDYYKFLSKNKLFENTLYEIIKLYLSKIKNGII